MWRYGGTEVWGRRGMGVWRYGDLGFRIQGKSAEALDMEKRHRAACWFGKGYETQVHESICGDTGTRGVDAPGCDGREQDIASGKKPGNEATTHTAS